MKTGQLLIAKHLIETTPKLRDALYEGGHVGALLVWAMASIVVGLALAAFAS